MVKMRGVGAEDENDLYKDGDVIGYYPSGQGLNRPIVFVEEGSKKDPFCRPKEVLENSVGEAVGCLVDLKGAPPLKPAVVPTENLKTVE